MNLRRFVLAASALVLALVVGCSGGTSNNSSGGGGSGDACATVCDCVAGKGGDRAQCSQQCGSIAAQTKSPKADCESALASNGYASCNSTCSTFASALQSGGGGGDETATMADFCAKCAECVSDSSFDEGFCTPFKSGSGFDTASCTEGGKVSSLAKPSLSKSALSAMSCKQFDDAE